MALTLPSSLSLINLNDTKTSKTSDEFLPNMVSFNKPSTSRLRVRSSMHEAHLSHDKSMHSEGWKNEQKEEQFHTLPAPHVENGSRVPIFVMLPLDTINMKGKLNKPKAMNASLMALKSGGISVVEENGPGRYNWDGYAELVKMVQSHGLKLQVVMSCQ
ncbi:hypothetical protein Leryth_003940 [Lithospermum erythrorhizon]|nr:hypothetical protein Leryth_003940 [Lithospermum erythrorhizon]